MTAPVNIAVIKYWGKRDTKLILPTNSSLSLTLDQDSLNSNTTVVASKDFEQDQFFLNGKEINISDSKRMVAVISQMRANAQACVFTTASISPRVLPPTDTVPNNGKRMVPLLSTK